MAAPYRDESEALRARVRDLEGDLAEARAEIHRLTRVSGAPGKAGVFFGAPLALEQESVLDGEIDETAFEVLVERLNQRLGASGRTSMIGRRFGYAVDDRRGGQLFETTVRPQDGKTTIVVRERLSQLAGGLFGGIIGGLGGGGLPGVIGLSIFAGLGMATPLAAVAWVAFVWLLVRTLYRAIVGRKQRRLAGLSREIVAICRHHLPPEARRRIADEGEDDEAEVTARAEEEAAAAEDAALQRERAR